jgi:molybdopterin molybdotransferase
MVSIEEAQDILLNHAPPLGCRELPLLQGLGRVICGEVRSPWDMPLSDNSAMDGYAFSYRSLQGDRLVADGFIPAGVSRSDGVPAGAAVRIMTGAPVPPGCDTVVPIEEVEVGETAIRLTGRVQQGSHIRRRGEDVRAGECVVPDRSLIRPQEIGMLASLGMTTVAVYPRVRVGILATGDELLPLGGTPVPGKIVNSNSVSLAAQVLDAGAEPSFAGIAPDDFEATKKMIRAALQASDLLVTTGGVSVGDKDYVKEAIRELGGEILFWKVNMKPGKPVAFAVLDGKPVFALPGNPVAAMVGFEQFVRPALLQMMGQLRIFRPVVQAYASEPFRNKGERPHLVRVMVTLQDGAYHVSAVENQSSANLLSLIKSNGLLRLPPEASLAAGDAATVTLLDRGFEMGAAASRHFG